MNSIIINNLQVLLDQAKQSSDTKDKFRVKAYSNAIKAIKNSTTELQSGKDALQLPGVGKKIADKIQEIINTGKLHQVEELGGDELATTSIITTFTGIWGVGPVKAKELYSKGARTISDLGKPEFFDLLNDNQKIGYKYYYDLQKRLPREALIEPVSQIASVFSLVCKEMKWKLKYKVCGSFRRQAKTCGDVDILLCPMKDSKGNLKGPKEGPKKMLSVIVEKLAQKGILKEKLGLGDTKYMGIINVQGTAFRIDIEIITQTEWAFALLYFTGSGSFNEKQRLVAKKMGYSLSEHGLKDVTTGEYINNTTHSEKFLTEKDIFDFLQMKFVKPENR